MPLKEEFEIQGNWLFRWRSYLPVIIIALLPFVVIRYTPHIQYEVREYLSVMCFLISLGGLGIRMVTLGFVPPGTSGRNTKRQVADTLNTTGIYSVVRHPLYLGNFIIILGVVLSTFIWWFVLVISLLFWIYYERIMYAEEAFLIKKFGEPYEKWARNTAAFIPNLRKMKSPDLPFSWKFVVKREYTGLFAIIVLFSFMELLLQFVEKGRLYFPFFWMALLVFGILFYTTILLIKKKTRLLHATGR